MKTRTNLVALLFSSLLVLPTSVWAQCGTDDGFRNGPCCVLANPTLPVFPPCQIAGTGACIRDCGVELQFNTGNLIIPQQVLCDYWFMQISVNTAAFTLANQLLVAKYSRTWMEFPTTASPSQVWRFIVNGDVQYSSVAAGAVGCPVPFSAVAPFNLPVHMIGHIDYVLNCATNQWTCSYSLTHLCETDMHASFSARPLPAAMTWPRRTYHLVAPANFNFNALCPAPQGPIVADATRNSRFLGGVPYTCLNETPIQAGFLSTAGTNCDCFTPGGFVPPNRNVHQTLQFGAGCNGVASGGGSIPIPGVLPTGLRATIVGSWINPTGALTYPGNECLTIYMGVLNYQPICSPIATPIHAVTGIGTTGGYPYQLFGGPAIAGTLPQFLDLVNMLIVAPPGGAPFSPGLGALFASDNVWSFNM